MANEEHLARLREALEKKDISIWNKWREENLNVEVDLRQANLMGAILINSNLQGAILVNSNLQGANLFAANLQKALLDNANLQGAKLQGAKLQRARIKKADLRNADLAEANLEGTDLGAANLENANVRGVQFNRWTKYRGIRASTCYGSPIFKRFAQDQEFIEEFRESRWRFPIYFLWLIFADCGRSFLLWVFWCISVVLGFACRYWNMGPACFKHTDLPWQPISAIYYSVIAFTTLGFGDVAPKTISAMKWVISEEIMGYIMLGGLISIFVNKLARRS